MEIKKNGIKNGMFNYLLITLSKGKTKRRKEKSTIATQIYITNCYNHYHYWAQNSRVETSYAMFPASINVEI